MKDDNQLSMRVKLIQMIKEPFGLLVLIPLILESLLVAVVSTGLEDGNKTYLIIGSLIILVIITIGIFLILTKNLKQPKVEALQYDLFISAPMKGGAPSEEEYKNFRSEVIQNIIKPLRTNYKLKVFYSGEVSDDISATVIDTNNFDAIRNSSFFVLIYPKSVVSTVLVETGFAFALEKPTLLCCKSQEDMPNLIKEANNKFHFVRNYNYDSIGEILNGINTHLISKLNNGKKGYSK